MPQGWTPVAAAPEGWTPVAPPPAAPADSWRMHPINAQEGEPGTIDKLNEMLGPLAHPQTLTDFARLLTLPVDSVKKAAAAALSMAASRGPIGNAMSATGRVVEKVGTASEGPAKMATAYEMVTDPKRAILTMAAPKVIQMAGRGLQRVGSAVSGPAVAEAAPIAAEATEAAPAGIKATGSGAALPDQKALNEAALAAKRAAYQATQKSGPVAVESIVKASRKMQLTAPEFKEFQRLIQRGVSLPDAEEAVKMARELAGKLGVEPPPVSATKFPKGWKS